MILEQSRPGANRRDGDPRSRCDQGFPFDMLGGADPARRGVNVMCVRVLTICAAALAAVLVLAMPSWAQNPGATRFGVWDNSENKNNVMTYEPYEQNGMKITVSNPSDPKSDWSYVTLFDGKFRPVTGQQNSETAVEVINEKSTRIYNKRDGVVYQVVINTLSDDNSKINNEYIRMDKDGKITGVTHVTYIRRAKK
jgi:hypothetical protein